MLWWEFNWVTRLNWYTKFRFSAWIGDEEPAITVQLGDLSWLWTIQCLWDKSLSKVNSLFLDLKEKLDCFSLGHSFDSWAGISPEFPEVNIWLIQFYKIKASNGKLTTWYQLLSIIILLSKLKRKTQKTNRTIIHPMIKAPMNISYRTWYLLPKIVTSRSKSPRHENAAKIAICWL